ncbi:mandelate racemase/muconate lactonizing enzyme family protein [Plantactinospora soyae]|uniref:L-alanine-DL-glutamate epimerase-like enolase superfamily enzyme n=1 Tax=Plantactinospora soyae TaxID=1544732 RepID=A0A927R860_9ACTN|nr:mandelate racemase/muconate lactonizing enzyme family protein [Plantactinospora soyae]MBE1488506.1 L-alanine-DL-glutamate epimerase-like enolase superfamily enzyme [Plantactinospora soyae]
MRITALESLHCAAGTRVWSFLKLSTDAGITGWAEYTDNQLGSTALGEIIARLGQRVVGADPGQLRLIEATLHSTTREAAGGLTQRAIGAIVNAALDAKARALDVPVHALFGGPVRDRIPLYWSHCGLGRIRMSEALGTPPLRDLDDIRALGAEVRDRGFRALKTNLMGYDGSQVALRLPAWGGDGFPELELTPSFLRDVVEVVAAFRAGAGPDVEVLLDVNFNVKGEGIGRLARALEPYDLSWLEVDTFEPYALVAARRHTSVRIASGEALYTARAYRPFFEARAMDVPIVDVAWNGFPEAVRVADLADSYDLNIAPHNYAGHLLTYMSAQLAAVAPNLAVLEYDVDGVPWRDEVFSEVPEIVDGHLVVPSGPGWGCVPDEEAIRAHPVGG